MQHQPVHAGAFIGLAKTYFKNGDVDAAQEALDLVPEADRKGDDYNAVAAALKLQGEAAGLSQAGELEARIEGNPDDLQARYDLAVVLNAEGKRVEAAEVLLGLMRRDRDWNDDGARRKLVEFFDAWGAKDPATVKGRRLLSSLLFS